MATTLVVVENAVRLLMRDLAPDAYAVDSDILRQAVVRQMQKLGERFGPADYWVNNAIALSDTGATEFYMAAATVGKIIEAKLESTKWHLQRLPRHVIEGLRERQTPPEGGDPTAFYWVEGQNGISGLSLWPRPNKVDSVSVMLSTIPGDGADDDAAVPFSSLLVSAIEWRSAAQLLGTLVQEDLDRLKINPNIIPFWLSQAAEAEREESVRRARMTRPSHVMAQVR